jgi:hypothetical protein
MYFKRIALLVSFFISGFSGQTFQSDDLEYNLSTPMHTMQTHINFLQEDNYHPEIAAKAINPKYVSSKEEAANLVIKLLQVYRAEGILIDLGDMPNETNYVDSVTKKSIYRISSNLPDVYLQKDGNRWYYSKKTIQSIGQLHKSVYPFGVDKLMTLLPKMGGRKIMGLHLWQYFGILFIIILCVVIHKVFTVLITGLIFKVLERLKDADEAKKFVKKVAKPTSVLVLYPFLFGAGPGTSIAAQTKWLYCNGPQIYLATFCHYCSISYGGSFGDPYAAVCRTDGKYIGRSIGATGKQNTTTIRHHNWYSSLHWPT